MIVLEKGKDAFGMYDFYMATATKMGKCASGRSRESALRRLKAVIERTIKRNKEFVS